MTCSHPPVAISRKTTTGFKTGAWRNLTPRYVRRLPPCREACPVCNDVAGWLTDVAAGDWKGAAEKLAIEQPLPAVCGRVCYHPCESSCNRQALDEPIAIRDVERKLGDLLAEQPLPKSVKSGNQGKVLIVGSGPAGLSAAWMLAGLGYRVEMRERAPLAGGLLRYGIPAYRLPKDVLDREIAKIAGMGVKIECSREWDGSGGLAAVRKGFDALLVSPGAAGHRSSGIQSQENFRLMDASEFLARTAAGDPPLLDSHLCGDDRTKVAVIGGGNSALDAARTALRLGAQATVLYRRTRAEMPAYKEEVDAALVEGINIEYLITPSHLHRDSRGLSVLRCLRNVLGKPDSSGRRKPEIVPGSEFDLPADLVIEAVGDYPDASILTDDSDEAELLRKIGEHGQTGLDGVWVGGDFSNNERTVAHAIGDGKRAAIDIHLTLTGQKRRAHIPPGSVGIIGGNGLEDRYDNLAPVDRTDLNLAYFMEQPRLSERCIELETRLQGFDEIALGQSERALIRGASRCFQCGICNDCGNCHVFCPDGAVVRGLPDGALIFDLDHCKGCGVCATECPRAAIEMAR